MQDGCPLQGSRLDHSVCECLGEDSVTAAVSTSATITPTAAGATTAATAVAATTGATTTTAATITTATATAGTACSAATPVAAATTVAAAATTRATTAEATWPLFAWASFIDDQGTAVHLLTIHAVDGRLGFGIGAHFHEAKTF